MKLFAKSTPFKGISLAMALALAFPATAFAGAKKVRSNKATVLVQQSVYKGAILFVDQDLLVLKEKDSEELLGFAFADVEKVSIRKSKAGIGMLIGLGVGVGLAALLIGSVKKDGDNVFAALLVVPLVLAAAVVAGTAIALITSTAGGLIGLLVGKKNFKLGRMSPEKKAAALAKLKKYAVFPVLLDELRAKLVMVGKP